MTKLNKYKKIKTIALILVIVLCCFAIVFVGIKSKEYHKNKICSNLVIKIENEEKPFVSDKEIAKILNDRNIYPIGKHFDSIQTEKIENTVENLAVVKKAECYKSSNGEIHLDITQRKPLFRVISHLEYYIDDEGKKMPTSHKYTAYVPIVTGVINPKIIKNGIFEFVKFIEKNEFWHNQIVQIDVNNKEEINLVPRVGNHIIKLGKLDNYEQKLKKLQKFYINGLNRIGWNQYKSIDLRFNNQVICK